MPRLQTVTESRHLASRAAARLAERAYDALWALRRRTLPMVLLKDQRPLSESELLQANATINWIEKVIEVRPAYLEQHGLSAAIHFPQAVWALKGEALYDGLRAVLSRDPRVLNYLRLWSQQFTGYRLLSMEPAEGRPFPRAEEIGESIDQKLRALGTAPDRWVGRYLRLSGKLPPQLRISPPRQFGEIGWNLDGRTVSYDTYVYLERLALIHESGVLERLRRIADAGRTPYLVEIGGGFGGLAYYLANLVPEARIVIVDIPESLIFSSLYLSLLWPRRTHVFASPETAGEPLVPDTPGCTFVPNYLFERLIETGERFDLAINTLSMSEMDASQVEYYCRGLLQLLSEDGVFFEQNQNNTPLGRLDAQSVIARHFCRRQELGGGIVGPLTQGRAHLWSKKAGPRWGEDPAAGRARSAGETGGPKFRSRSAVDAGADRVYANSQ